MKENKNYDRGIKKLKFSKWSIGMVNYNSSVYVKWQLKILFEANSEDDFQLIIVDNSESNDEFQELKKLCKSYHNITLLQHSPKCTTASGQHGEGLDIIRELSNSKYFLVQDPDFFWLKKDYLKWLEKLLQYNDAVGVPYHNKVPNGQEYFPSAFGCAYIHERIKNISFMPYNGDIETSFRKHEENLNNKESGYDFSYDVGWRVRESLSQSTDDNFISFSQLRLDESIFRNFMHSAEMSSHSFDFCSSIYHHNGKIVALHLFRGTFTGEVSSYSDPKRRLTSNIVKTRNSIAQLMYTEILNYNPKLNSLYDKTLKKTMRSVSEEVDIGFVGLEFSTILWYLLLYVKRIKILKILIPIKSSYIKHKIILSSFKRT